MNKIALVEFNLGNIAFYRSQNQNDIVFQQNQQKVAYDYYRKSLATRRQLADKQGIADCQHNLANLAMQSSDYPQAWDSCTEMLSSFRELGNKLGIAHGLEAFASLAALTNNQWKACVCLCGAAAALRKEINCSLSSNALKQLNSELATVKAVIGDEDYDAAWDRGYAMTIEEAIEYALNNVTV